MAIQTGNDGNDIFASINITPLTDIFLVLLIIFMVATAVTIESAAHVDLPKLEAPAHPQQTRVVTISYTSDHHIYVNGKHVSEADLRSAVHDALIRSPEKTVVFDGDPSVILGDMVRIVDIAKSSGAQQIALAVSGNSSTQTTPMSAPPIGEPIPQPIAPGGEAAPEPVAPSP
ncbi:MAG: biopolymer transporter ExbD [Deltaproteobacteria bacterium]|nr:biopolymer transporter ExbD [Deltaproteobacteria bacterium]